MKNLHGCHYDFRSAQFVNDIQLKKPLSETRVKDLHKLPEIRPVIRRYQILVHSLTAYLRIKCSDNNKNNQ